MGGNFLNLLVALLCGAAFMYQVDLFCDWLVLPHRSKTAGLFLVGLAAVTFAVMLANMYLFMRS